MSETNQTTGPAGRQRRTRGKGRLEAFSDGVFAVAITLLALDLAVPASTQTQRHLLDAIGEQWPAYLGYVVSFATIGALWLGHNAITDYLERVDITFLRLNLLVLMCVSFLPFPTLSWPSTSPGIRLSEWPPPLTG